MDASNEKKYNTLDSFHTSSAMNLIIIEEEYVLGFISQPLSRSSIETPYTGLICLADSHVYGAQSRMHNIEI
jgi:hypothetical protein